MFKNKKRDDPPGQSHQVTIILVLNIKKFCIYKAFNGLKAIKKRRPSRAVSSYYSIMILYVKEIIHI